MKIVARGYRTAPFPRRIDARMPAPRHFTWDIAGFGLHKGSGWTGPLMASWPRRKGMHDEH
jgi:hypothetical protein